MKSIKAAIPINRIKTTNLLPVHTSTRDTQLLNIIAGFTDSGGPTFFRIIFPVGVLKREKDVIQYVCLANLMGDNKIGKRYKCRFIT